MKTRKILKWTFLILAIIALIAFIIIVTKEPVVQQYGYVGGGC